MSTYGQRVQGAIMAALQRRETVEAAALICHLSHIDPEAAQRIRDAIDEVEARNRARRGALYVAAEEERLREEYRDERADWWAES